MRAEDPTPQESAFFDTLEREIPQVQDWYHHDAVGLWMIVSLDLPMTPGTPIVQTWRCDYDGQTVLGGLSPGFLNWDDGIRAIAAEVDIDGPTGLRLGDGDPRVAAENVAAWFRTRIAAFSTT